MALYKHQFLLLLKYLIKIQINQLVSDSRNLSSLYKSASKKVQIKDETKENKSPSEEICKKYWDYNNVWYNPRYNLITMGLSVKIDHIIRRSARCFLIPKSYSKSQIRFIMEPPKHVSILPIRNYSDDNSDKPCQRIDSSKKLSKLCERLSSKSKASGNSKEAKIISLETEQDRRREKLETGTILLRGDPDYSLVNGIPTEIICWRRVRIYQPRKNPMQSGTRNIGHWEVDYEAKERWENPLMGWASSGDPVSSVKLRFSTKEEAIEYCNNNNLEYYVQQSKTTKKFKPKSYGINFHHKNRTRLSTK